MTYEIVGGVKSETSGNNSFELREFQELGKLSLACPPFTLERDLKCFPQPTEYEFYQKVLCDRLIRAIALAEKAASQLLRTPVSPDTVDIFRKIFDQTPDELWEIPGMARKSVPAGAIVAYRFRKIAQALRTRNTLYRCRPCKPGGGNNYSNEQSHPLDTIIQDPVAWAVLCKDEVWLCPQFWHLKPEEQIGTVLHEMFHLCYGLTCAWFQHDFRERKRNSAYCYEAFALSLIAGFHPNTSKCSVTPK